MQHTTPLVPPPYTLGFKTLTIILWTIKLEPYILNFDLKESLPLTPHTEIQAKKKKDMAEKDVLLKAKVALEVSTLNHTILNPNPKI